MDKLDLFDKKYLSHVRTMREQFFSTGSMDGIEGVRSDILACWEASYILEQEPRNLKKGRVPDAEFQQILQDSHELLEVAEPYMQLLRGFLTEDSFWITLMNNQGVILKLVGSPKMLKVAQSTDLVEGSFRGSAYSYPGLFYACWQFDKPFQIVSTEHPASIDDDLAGAASPIHEIGTGKLLGVIGISGYWWKSHDHTLGLTIMAAEAISQQLALRRQNADIVATNRKLNTALETLDSGAVYFRRDGSIYAANSHAAEMLCATASSKKQFAQKNIFSYLNNHVSSENFEEIEEILEHEKVFSCDLIPVQKYHSLHCSISKVADHVGEYFMQLQKSSALNRIVADRAFSQASFTFKDIIGESLSLRAAKDTAEIAAQHGPAVLITGESGTGKEMFAQALHNSSSRANGPFVAINCGAIPKSLVESELFGYEAGAFTGAQKGGRVGKFEMANGGTIFLDEIGDMPYETQIALLRVLQTKEVVRIGGKTPIKIDVHVIAATNQDLKKRIADNTFRQDLYYRLNVLNIHLPALRERLDDLLPLSNYFMEKYGCTFDKRVTSISKEALEIMMKYSWPGNVRELENVIERAVIICSDELIKPRDLPEQLYLEHKETMPQTTFTPTAMTESELSENEQIEMAELINALEENNGNLSVVAKYLGISRPTVYRKLKKYALHRVKNPYEKQGNSKSTDELRKGPLQNS